MQPGNPYVIERPLTAGDIVVGRQRALAEVVQTLRAGVQLMLVFGSARMGKTSFLRLLQHELQQDTRTVQVDVAWPPHYAAAEARPIAEQLVHSIETKLISVVQPLIGGEALQGQAPASGDQRALVALIDGLGLHELGSPVGPVFIDLLQSSLVSHPLWHAVITVQGTARGSALKSPSIASLPAIELTAFNLAETEELLTRCGREQIRYEFNALQRIHQLTAGSPYLIQLFGYQLVLDRLANVRMPDVDACLPKVLTHAAPVFERMWSAGSRSAQAVLSLSNELKGRHGVITADDLATAAANHGLSLTLSDLSAGLEEWAAEGVLRPLNDGCYSVCCEVMSRWIAEQRQTVDTLVKLKYLRPGAARASTAGRYSGRRWSTLSLELLGLALVAAVLVLWNMRGAAQQLTMGPAPTATAAPFATRATLVIGPSLGRIAYMAKDGPDNTWDIWLMRGDGTQPQQLTSDSADDMSPSWSVDGKRIAFVSDRDGNREIYTMKADGTEQVNFTHHGAEDWTPAWSPDGQRIAFSSYRDGNWEIYVARADGNDVRRVTDHKGADYGPAWSPDGERLAFHSNRDGNWEIYAVHVDGSGLSRLTTDQATDYNPAWSPDGRVIAFESYRDGDMEIYVMNADGSELQNLTNDPYSNEHGPCWARDGSRLLYFSSRDGGWDIFSMRPDGSEKSNLTQSSALEQTPRWHE